MIKITQNLDTKTGFTFQNAIVKPMEILISRLKKKVTVVAWIYVDAKAETDKKNPVKVDQIPNVITYDLVDVASLVKNELAEDAAQKIIERWLTENEINYEIV